MKAPESIVKSSFKQKVVSSLNEEVVNQRIKFETVLSQVKQRKSSFWFNDYRFSVMLVPNLPDKPELEIKFIKNEKWKNCRRTGFYG